MELADDLTQAKRAKVVPVRTTTQNASGSASALDKAAKAAGRCDATPPESPLIVYCRKCSTIFGDTCTFVCTHTELRTVTLSAATAVTVREDEPETSTSGVTSGSTFLRVHCESCGARVGRYYRSTVRDLDLMRDGFSFDQEAIGSYELGSTGGPGVGGRAGGGQAAGPAAEARENGGIAPTAAATRHIEAIETQLLKVENLMLLFNERIEVLEAHIGIGN